MTKLVIKNTPYSYRILSGSLTAYMDLVYESFEFNWAFEFGVEPLFKQPEDYDDLPIPFFSDLNAHEQIGDPTMADAILDRLVHSAHKIKLKGESMRKKNANLT